MNYTGTERRKPNGDHQLVAEAAVVKVLGRYGVDVENPIAMQKDHAWTRKRRVAGEQVGKMATRYAIAVVVTGAFGAVWLFVKDHILK